MKCTYSALALIINAFLKSNKGICPHVKKYHLPWMATSPAAYGGTLLSGGGWISDSHREVERRVRSFYVRRSFAKTKKDAH